MNGSQPLFIPSKIIVHHADSGTDALAAIPVIRNYHLSKGWADVGYHGFCGRTVFSTPYFENAIGRPWDMVGAHTIGQNEAALGICFLGSYQTLAPPQAMLITGAKLIAYWCRHFNIPASEIYPHRAFNATDCPGDKFPMDTLRQLVEAAL